MGKPLRQTLRLKQQGAVLPLQWLTLDSAGNAASSSISVAICVLAISWWRRRSSRVVSYAIGYPRFSFSGIKRGPNANGGMPTVILYPLRNGKCRGRCEHNARDKNHRSQVHDTPPASSLITPPPGIQLPTIFLGGQTGTRKAFAALAASPRCCVEQALPSDVPFLGGATRRTQ